MRYRKLPHGNEQISEIGLGLGNIHNATDAQIEETFRYAIEHGVNLFDFCSGRIAVYEILGRVAKEAQAPIHTQMHFGACYEKDTYGFSRDLDLIKAVTVKNVAPSM